MWCVFFLFTFHSSTATQIPFKLWQEWWFSFGFRKVDFQAPLAQTDAHLGRPESSHWFPLIVDNFPPRAVGLRLGWSQSTRKISLCCRGLGSKNFPFLHGFVLFGSLVGDLILFSAPVTQPGLDLQFFSGYDENFPHLEMLFDDLSDFIMTSSLDAPYQLLE